MSAKKQTIFNKLNQVLNPDHISLKTTQPSKRYNIGNNEIIRTTDKEEYERAKLQALQNKHLGRTWKKVETGLFQQSINYETTRIGSYSDFEAMEFYPTIAAALDIMMEESTTVNDNGKIMNIYSDSKRIKGILEDLFFNRLDVHTSLPMWIRNVCKYGDNFVFLNINDTHGILSSKQLPNYEMERIENDMFDMMTGKAMSDDQASGNVKFIWRGRDVELNSWQVAHFRLLGDDRRLPYGTSILEKARRIWKQLVLSEDSMLVYRVTRAPERRVYKIYVGNIDDADVEAYVNTIADRFKRTQVIDPATGQIDLRFNQLANDQDYFIPVRSEDAPNPIDTLPGAQNLDQIADIKYLQRNLFTALRVPKPFLGFEESAGNGKNLALQDIRFSRTINRIQQSILQELNKIAIIHLYLLGFEDEIDNFTLTLNNPSTQAEMLKIEHLQNKITLLKDAVSDTGNGFGAMSWTRAHREILGWSDDEIKQDLIEQRMEKAASAELANTANVIKHTGMFDTVDRIYGDYKMALNGGLPEGGAPTDAEEGDAMGGGGGGFGGGGGGGEDLDFGADEDQIDAEEGDADAGGDLDFGDAEADGGDTDAGAEEVTPEPVSEGIKRLEKKLLKESTILRNQLDFRTKKYQAKWVDVLIESFENKEQNKSSESTKMTDKHIKINDGINNMIKDINNILEE